MSDTTQLFPTTASSAVRSPRLRARLGQDGHVTVPLLTADELAAVTAAHRHLGHRDDAGLTIDYMRPDRSVMAAVRDVVVALVGRAFDEMFLPHRVIMATFVTKHPGPDSEMFLHEDRVFVDESRHRAVTAWIPLVPTGREHDNGALQVVTGSHLLPIGPSGSNTSDAIRPFETELRRRLTTLDVGAGDAALYDSRLVHASLPNRSAGPRTALVCVVIPEAAQPVHVVATPEGTLRVHAVDEDFYVTQHPRMVERSMPERYPIVDEVAAPAPLTASDIEALPAP